MVMRKAPPSSSSGSNTIVYGNIVLPGNGRFDKNRMRILLGFLILIALLTLQLANSKKTKNVIIGPTTTITTTTTTTTTTTEPQSPQQTIPPLDNCPLIHKLLQGEIPSSTEGLPSAGKPTTFGAVFWLKSPVLRATLPESGVDVVLLKYNKYLPKQHTLKWSNTVSILSEHRDGGRVFPQIFAHCKDPGDGFHYILVEWIDLHPTELGKPKSFEQCYARLDKLMNIFVILDEEMHLAFMDVKRGQWMSRRDENSFVLQDVDDIVRSPWIPSNEAGDLYHDQVETAQILIQSYLAKNTPIGYVKKLWDEEFFPNGYTIRYTMILLSEIVQNDIGFRWHTDCSHGMPEGFLSCFAKVLEWGATVKSTWPAPKQALWAFDECRKHGKYDANSLFALRPKAIWRDAVAESKEKSSKTKSRYISCFRSSDPLKKTDKRYTENLSWCETTPIGEAILENHENNNKTTTTTNERSCCRGKEGYPCYYYVHRDQNLCV